jgi:PLP dependent protein
MDIKKNITEYQSRLSPGCALIAVSKTHPPEKIMQAYEAGQRDFGENKVQEMVSKYDLLPKDIRWHMIGHLQTNKVKYIAPFVYLIHAVDSWKLVSEINKQAARVNRIIPCLLQVHIAREETKFGFSITEVEELMASAEWNTLGNIRVIGLMGMATNTDDQQTVREEFKSLYDLFQRLKSAPLPNQVSMEQLSIGMSSDYTIAIEEGSTMVRIGSAIFGERTYP